MISVVELRHDQNGEIFQTMPCRSAAASTVCSLLLILCAAQHAAHCTGTEVFVYSALHNAAMLLVGRHSDTYQK